ncbi:MAG: bifunctional folylpolyglutamate synthase/dihydrofolate synthase [Dorea sp.]|nr:bifunctional folylpolyglutamate synthase/dihydrofolate synthase [Dorea sp.]
MLYEEARVYLDHVSKYGSVLGLDSIKSLLEELGNPQKDLTFIHIAGTNGKGSILAYLSQILTEAGYRTGRYISPTVMEYLERFQIDGKYMKEEEFAEITGSVKRAAEKLVDMGKPSPTAFEIETAIAFEYFRKRACDFVVLEAGMGGALDATNIIENTKLCIFASISMDHIGVLGDTLEEITENKAGILKKGAAAVTGRQQECVLRILRQKAEEMGCPIFLADPEKVQVMQRSLKGQQFSYQEYEDLEISLTGQCQIENAVTVLEAVKVLRCQGIRISQEAVRQGLKNTRWPGRFTVYDRKPMVIIDGAHNEDAAKRLAQNISMLLPGRKVTAVMGVFQDKEYEKMITIMAPFLKFVYTIDLPNRERTLEKEVLCERLKKQGIEAETAESIEEALRLAKQREKEDGAVLVFGSLSYLGDVIRLEEKAAERN